ncbi:MAG: PEP/pyruvate-binding domain-containing protein, partial [Chloroflexota bacterium]
MQDLVVPLDRLNRASLAAAGGKAANLGELLRGGFNVPGGYCLTTNAYREFVAAAGLAPLIAALPAGLDVTNADGLAVAGSAIRDLFMSAAVPEDVDAAVRLAHAPFADAPVAVRSSATAEDLPDASFAGQQDTYLNVVGTEATLAAVRRCWASLWTDRAIAYRQRNGIPQDAVALAAVVQRMVPAEVAGVLFTANPVNGKRTDAVIDASLGLGEAVVSGAVSPDNYVVDKRSLEILARRIGAKQVQVVPQAGGGTEQVAVEAEASARPALTDEQIRALGRVGTAIEAHFGWPQDVEWAFAGGELYVLQSRPITSLYPLPAAPSDDRVHVYFSLNSAQGMLEPFTPMGESLFVEMACAVFAGGDRRRAFIRGVGNRLYADVTPIVYGPLAQIFPRLVLPQIEPVIGRILLQLVAEGRFGDAVPLRRTDAARFLWRFRRGFGRIVPLVARNFLFPERARHRLRHELIPVVDEAVTATRQPLRLGQQPDVLVGLFDGILRKQMFPRIVTLIIAGMASYTRADALVKEWGLDERKLVRVRQGLRYNVTTTMDLDLWSLSQRTKADPGAAAVVQTSAPADLAAAYLAGTLPPTVQTGVREFLRRYGHRAVREIDLGIPRWDEDPTYLFGVMHNYMTVEDPELAANVHFAHQEAQAKQAIEDLLAEAMRMSNGRQKARMLGFFLRRYRELGGLREAPKFYIMWIFRALRRMML